MARRRLIQVRRDTAATWTSRNPTLASGEFGYETDTGKVKIGNGSTAWNSLAYLAPGGGVATTRTLTAGSGLSGGGDLSADRTFDVNVDGSTLEISSDTLRVKDGGITSAKILDGTIAVGDLAFDPATQAELDAHITDTTDAHDASAVSIADSGGYYTGTDVEAALQEIGAGGIGGSGSSFGVEVPSGTVNGSNDTFTLSEAPDPSADLLLWKNGLLMKQGLDYTLSSDTITFDAAQIPQTGDILLAAIPTSGGGGGPTWTDWTPTATGLSGALSINVARYAVNGSICTVKLDAFGTSNATTFEIAPPITPQGGSVPQPIWIFDNGAAQTTPGRIDTFGSSGTEFRFGKNMSAAGGFTASAIKGMSAVFSYEI